jgi:hypothetical protein
MEKQCLGYDEEIAPHVVIGTWLAEGGGVTCYM